MGCPIYRAERGALSRSATSPLLGSCGAGVEETVTMWLALGLPRRILFVEASLWLCCTEDQLDKPLKSASYALSRTEIVSVVASIIILLGGFTGLAKVCGLI
jgi:hypothetical protein